MKSREKHIAQSRDTGMALVLICLLLMLAGQSQSILILAIILLIVTMTRPQLFSPFSKVWFGFAHYLGTVVSSLLLTSIYYVVVTPVAIVRRSLGADAMRLKQWRKNKTSVFVVREHTYSREDMEKPY
jgi:hypothetical protein